MTEILRKVIIPTLPDRTSSFHPKSGLDTEDKAEENRIGRNVARLYGQCGLRSAMDYRGTQGIDAALYRIRV